MTNQESKQLPVPPLTSEQVQILMNYVNEQMPMKWGKEILVFIEKVAIESIVAPKVYPDPAI